MNVVVLTGRLTKDVELSYTTTGTAKAIFTLAVDRIKKTEDQTADFIRITVWSAQAENCNRYLHKGSKCAVHGRIQTGSYKDRNGQTVWTTDVIAERVEFLDSKSENREKRDYPPQQTYNATDDDLPY